MTPHGFRAMARTILDEVLGFRPDFIEHQLAQRAIWLRLLPMRATCRVRSCSTSAAAALARRQDTRTGEPAARDLRPSAGLKGGSKGRSPLPAPAGDPRSVAPKGRLALPP